MTKDRKWVLDFLDKNKICVFATANLDSKPEAATVVYASDKKLNFYLVSFKAARKYKNLLKNKKVSIVVGVDYNLPHTLQIDGDAEILRGKAIQPAFELLSKRFPFVKRTKNAVFIAVKPTFIRLYELLDGGEDIFTRIL